MQKFVLYYESEQYSLSKNYVTVSLVSISWGFVLTMRKMELLIKNERTIYLLSDQGFCARRTFEVDFNSELTTPPRHTR